MIVVVGLNHKYITNVSDELIVTPRAARKKKRFGRKNVEKNSLKSTEIVYHEKFSPLRGKNSLLFLT